MRSDVGVWSAAAALSLGVLAGAAFAGTPPADELKVGDQAPDFSLAGSDGKTYSLQQLKGQTVVLAWFPKAFTGG
jgi:thioredoxin-dependent peroxiredoxin